MKFAKFAVGLVMSVAFAHTANAAGAHGLVSCSDAKVKNGPAIFSYLISNGQSQRLSSDILYVQNSVTQVLPAFQVAQFAASDLALYMLIDDDNEVPTLAFAAVLPNTKLAFPGTLTPYVNGKAQKTQVLSCKLIPQ